MLVAVRISSYGRTWEVNQAQKQLLRFFYALQTSRMHP